MYVSFNELKECMRPAAQWQAEVAAQLHGWARQLLHEVGPPPATFGEAYCCTQFAVSAARIRRRSHAFWRALLADLLDGEVPAVCKLSRGRVRMGAPRQRHSWARAAPRGAGLE